MGQRNGVCAQEHATTSPDRDREGGKGSIRQLDWPQEKE